jgi:hypothetical protein
VPTSPLDPATAYELDIPTGLTDNFGFTTTQSFSQQFITGLNPNGPTTILSPYDTSRANSVSVNQGVFGAGSYIILRTAFIQPAAPVSAPSIDINKAISNKLNLHEVRRVEVLVDVNGGSSFSDAPAPVTLTLSAQPGTAGAAALMASSVDPATLTIYQYVAGKGLVAAPGAKNNGNGTATASITQSGVYVLAGTVSTSLSAAIAYPVPFKPSLGQTQIKFTNLADGSTIKVFTIMGALVAQLQNSPGQSTLPWNVTNLDGEPVASGVYIYQIKNSFDEKRGKLIIIR